MNIVYSNTSAQDAEASNEQPTSPSPRVESHRAPPSAPAPLSSSSHGLSAEADAFVDLVDDVGDDGEDTTPQDYTRDTNYAGRAAAAAAMTSDDETGDVDLDEAEPHLVEWSMEDYVKGMSSRDVEALALRRGYNKKWSCVSTVTAYLQTENSFNNREIYKKCGAVWNAEWKYWSIPPGRDLRRAYEGGWIVDGESHYTGSLQV